MSALQNYLGSFPPLLFSRHPGIELVLFHLLMFGRIQQKSHLGLAFFFCFAFFLGGGEDISLQIQFP